MADMNARNMVGASNSTPKAHGEGTNVGEPERIASLVGGGILALMAMRQRGIGRLLMMVGVGELLYRGVTGHSPVYRALNINTAETGLSQQVSVAHHQGFKISKSVYINRSPEELFAYWRNFENLPRIMSHLKSVEVQTPTRSHWVAKAPAGLSVEWDAEIINEIPGELIGWRSLEGAQVPNAGSVHFERAFNGQGTVLKVTLKYDPPGGALGMAVAKLFGEEPAVQIADDLRRFKQAIESGELIVQQQG